MKLKYSEDQPSVDYETAKKRALKYLTARPRDRKGRRIPIPANYVADAIWPKHQMIAQGAGGAASRILHRMAEEKLCYWTSINDGFEQWGWVAAS